MVENTVDAFAPSPSIIEVVGGRDHFDAKDKTTVTGHDTNKIILTINQRMS
jgi:hypothetical protein